MDQRIEHAAAAERLALCAALAVGVGGVMVFGSVVAGVGEWVEGRQLRTVAGWAIPALLLAVTAAAVAIRAVRTGKSGRLDRMPLHSRHVKTVASLDLPARPGHLVVPACAPVRRDRWVEA
jgi:hypothetical protein